LNVLQLVDVGADHDEETIAGTPSDRAYDLRIVAIPVAIDPGEDRSMSLSISGQVFRPREQVSREMRAVSPEQPAKRTACRSWAASPAARAPPRRPATSRAAGLLGQQKVDPLPLERVGH